MDESCVDTSHDEIFRYRGLTCNFDESHDVLCRLQDRLAVLREEWDRRFERRKTEPWEDHRVWMDRQRGAWRHVQSQIRHLATWRKAQRTKRHARQLAREAEKRQAQQEAKARLYAAEELILCRAWALLNRLMTESPESLTIRDQRHINDFSKLIHAKGLRQGYDNMPVQEWLAILEAQCQAQPTPVPPIRRRTDD